MTYNPMVEIGGGDFIGDLRRAMDQNLLAIPARPDANKEMRMNSVAPIISEIMVKDIERCIAVASSMAGAPIDWLCQSQTGKSRKKAFHEVLDHARKATSLKVALDSLQEKCQAEVGARITAEDALKSLQGKYHSEISAKNIAELELARAQSTPTTINLGEGFKCHDTWRLTLPPDAVYLIRGQIHIRNGSQSTLTLTGGPPAASDKVAQSWAEAKEQLAAANDKIQSLKAQLESSESLASSQQATLVKKNNEIDSLKQKLEGQRGANSDFVKHLEAKIFAQAKVIADLQAQPNQESKQAAELANKDKEIHALKVRLNGAEGVQGFAGNVIRQHEAIIADKAKVIGDLRAQLDQHASHLKVTGNALAEHADHLKARERVIAYLRDQPNREARLKTELAEAKNQLADVTAMLNDLLEARRKEKANQIPIDIQAIIDKATETLANKLGQETPEPWATRFAEDLNYVISALLETEYTDTDKIAQALAIAVRMQCEYEAMVPEGDPE